jgi:hypothetical protein
VIHTGQQLLNTGNSWGQDGKTLIAIAVAGVIFDSLTITAFPRVDYLTPGRGQRCVRSAVVAGSGSSCTSCRKKWSWVSRIAAAFAPDASLSGATELAKIWPER